MNDSYVYEYFNPSTNKVFYVGEGVDGRILSHLQETINGCPDCFEKHDMIKELLDKGYQPNEFIRYVSKPNLSKSQAQSLEGQLIDKYGLDNLTNRTGGLIESKRVPVPGRQIEIYSKDEYQKHLYENRMHLAEYIKVNSEIIDASWFIYSDGWNIRTKYNNCFIDVVIETYTTNVRLSTKKSSENDKIFEEFNKPLKWKQSFIKSDTRIRKSIKIGRKSDKSKWTELVAEIDKCLANLYFFRLKILETKP